MTAISWLTRYLSILTRLILIWVIAKAMCWAMRMSIWLLSSLLEQAKKQANFTRRKGFRPCLLALWRLAKPVYAQCMTPLVARVRCYCGSNAKCKMLIWFVVKSPTIRLITWLAWIWFCMMCILPSLIFVKKTRWCVPNIWTNALRRSLPIRRSLLTGLPTRYFCKMSDLPQRANLLRKPKQIWRLCSICCISSMTMARWRWCCRMGCCFVAPVRGRFASIWLKS